MCYRIDALRHVAAMVTVIAADIFADSTVMDWGGNRSAYLATEEELMLLLRAGASVITLNKDNGDGTYGHHVQYHGLGFKNSSNTKILISQDR